MWLQHHKSQMKLSALYLVIFLLNIGRFLQAQTPVLQVQVEAKQVEKNQGFQIEYVSTQGSLLGFVKPRFSDFAVVAGPMRSSQMINNNGNVSYRESVSFILQAPQVGKFTIDPASATINGQKVTSKPLTIEVVKGSSQAQPAQPNLPQHPLQSMFGMGSGGFPNQSMGMSQADLKRTLDKSLSIIPSLSRSKLLVGESAILTYKLYFAVNVQAYTPANLTFPNFTYETLNVNNVPKIEVLNGKRFNTIELVKYVITPNSAGHFELNSEPFHLTVEDPSEAGLGLLAGSLPVSIKPSSVTVDVESISGTAPADYLGTVGNFKATASIDKTAVTTDDALSLKIVVEGYGSLKSLKLPPLNYDPSSLEVFSPKIEEQNRQLDQDFYSTKIIEYILRPKKVGKTTLSLSLSSFNSNTNQFENILKDSFSLDVSAGSLADESVQKPFDFIPILGQNEASASTQTWWGSLGHLGALAAIALCGLAYWGFSRKKSTTPEGSPKPTKPVKPISNAPSNKALQEAESALNSSNLPEFYSELQKAVHRKLEKITDISTVGLNYSQLESVLREKQLPDTQIFNFLKVLENCDLAKYGGAYGQSPQQLLETVRHLVA